MKKIVIVAAFICGLSACGSLDLEPNDSLFSRQPRIVFVDPEDGATVSKDTEIALEFSRQIDMSTVSNQTLAVVKDVGGSEDIVESVSRGRVAGTEGLYNFDEDSRVVVFSPSQNFESGATYHIVATNGIMSAERIPFGTALVSSFTVEVAIAAGSEAASNGSASETTSGDEGAETEPAPSRPQSLVINEILYDISGDDTNGQLFVELFGDAGADIGGYKLNFVNGDNGLITGSITLPSGAAVGEDGLYLIADAKTGQSGSSFVEGADFIANFDPQNGPDCVQLLDETAGLVDALGYGTPIATLAENGLACFEGTPAARASSGQSLSRTEGADTGDNSADFSALTVPTQGSL